MKTERRAAALSGLAVLHGNRGRQGRRPRGRPSPVCCQRANLYRVQLYFIIWVQLLKGATDVRNAFQRPRCHGSRIDPRGSSRGTDMF